MIIGAIAQDEFIQDEKKILDFARHLYINNLYELSAQEYERLIFLNPDNSKYHRELLLSYRKGRNTEMLIKRSQYLYQKNPAIRLEYVLGLISIDNFTNANSLLEDYNYLQNDSLNIVAMDIENSISLLQNRRLKYVNTSNPVLQNLSIMYSQAKTKSPLTAGILSSILPGSGRIYTKDYTNALMSLLFIGGSAWQSYRRFEKNGISSVSGWIYGGISLGFYLGNIYGSVKSAKRYNKKLINNVDASTKNYITNITF